MSPQAEVVCGVSEEICVHVQVGPRCRPEGIGADEMISNFVDRGEIQCALKKGCLDLFQTRYQNHI